MKKLAVILMAVLLTATFASCAEAQISDMSSISEYMAPSYTHEIATGALSFAENIGETAIITKYIGLYTAHTVTVPEKINDRDVISIGNGAFYYCTAVTEVVLPSTLTTIDAWAFAGCTNLEKIVIPASVTSIGKGAFNGCTNLKSVVFEGTALETIGEYAFQGCAALETIALPTGLKTIGTQAFRGCESIKSIKAPETLETIGNLAFKDCTGLNAEGALVLSESIKEIGEFAFTSINKLYITAPEGSYAAKYVADMKDFEEEETEEVTAE
jgi:hypothetical protein